MLVKGVQPLTQTDEKKQKRNAWTQSASETHDNHRNRIKNKKE
jgi:hypothetical protein